jgi:1,4-dihydroxy-2-naphthoyl-CoA synthase
MITTTWMKAPADLLGLGSSDVRRCTDYDVRTGIAVSPAPRVAPVQGTGVPAGGTAVRLRADLGQASTQAQFEVQNPALAHNSIDGTTLGIHSSRRPLS